MVSVLMVGVPRERFEGVLESQTVSRGFLQDIQMEQNIVWSWFRECMQMQMVSVAADLEVNSEQGNIYTFSDSESFLRYICIHICETRVKNICNKHNALLMTL